MQRRRWSASSGLDNVSRNAPGSLRWRDRDGGTLGRRPSRDVGNRGLLGLVHHQCVEHGAHRVQAAGDAIHVGSQPCVFFSKFVIVIELRCLTHIGVPRVVGWILVEIAHRWICSILSVRHCCCVVDDASGGFHKYLKQMLAATRREY